MSKLKIASILLLVSTIVLKFSSMIRDLVIAHYFGASYIVDAYNAGMIIPNMFILFMLTGMKDAFVPSYIKYESQQKGFSHLTNVTKGTFYIGLLVSIIGILITPLLIPLLYPDFSAKAEHLAIWTSIGYFASVFLVGINAVYEGYFDARGKYSFSTFSQTVVVLCTIGSAILLHAQIGAYSLALGYLVGTLLSFLIKVIYLKPNKFIQWKQKKDLTEIKTFYLIFLPVGLTIMVGQINLNVNTIFAGSFGDGVISYLNYAFRFVSIPQAIFGVTTATIIYPILAKAKTTKEMHLFKSGMERGLSIMFMFLAPTVLGMVLLMPELIQIVYQRGAFDVQATKATTEVAYYYIGSVLFYSIQIVIAKGFYTLEKGHLMMRIGIAAIVLNILFNYLFSSLIGYKGLALSASVVGFFYTLIPFIVLYKLIGGFSLRNIGTEYLKIIISTLLMTLGVLSLNNVLVDFNVYLYVLIFTIVGGIIYIVTLYLLKSTSLKELILIRKRS